MNQRFPKPCEPFAGDVNYKVKLSNYAIKSDSMNATGVDISKFAEKFDLASLKCNVDKLDIDKLKNISTDLCSLKSKVDKLDNDKLAPVPVDLSKLTNVLKNEVVKKTEYNAKIKNIEDKIPDITNLATKTTLNGKINEVKGEIPSITNIATTTAFIAVESKIPNVSNLVKKNYNTAAQKLMKLKRRLLIIIMINMLLLQNLVT